eukprot:TRINITY_DN3821_c0_g1_i2.p2 TRINITY_DN3821_c0_g1~~TRINITY_DN3821_c0_g1_i2.p2  ORF type:complete len:253 (-),score=45.35 TRINITY_DN3821_c0_g1_i2:97-855(-)
MQQLQLRISELQSSSASEQHHSAQAHAALATARTRCQALEDAMALMRQRITELEPRAQAAETMAALLQQKKQATGEMMLRSEAAWRERQSAVAEASSLKERCAALAAALESCEENRTAAVHVAQAAREELVTISKRDHDRESELDAARQRLAGRDADVQQLKARLQACTSELNVLKRAAITSQSPQQQTPQRHQRAVICTLMVWTRLQERSSIIRLAQCFHRWHSRALVSRPGSAALERGSFWQLSASDDSI